MVFNMWSTYKFLRILAAILKMAAKMTAILNRIGHDHIPLKTSKYQFSL